MSNRALFLPRLCYTTSNECIISTCCVTYESMGCVWELSGFIIECGMVSHRMVGFVLLYLSGNGKRAALTCAMVG